MQRTPMSCLVAAAFGLALAAAQAAGAAEDGGAMPAMRDHGQMDMGDMHQHHHHMETAVQAGLSRSLARYDVPDVKLVDADGRQVALRSVLEKDGPVMVDFIFTTCTTVCPMLSATFARTQSLLAAKSAPVSLVSISIDPENDTPAKLREYAAKYHAGPGWTMLTGSLADSVAVQKAFATYAGDKMNHQPVTFLRANKDQAWVRLDGFASAEELAKEYQRVVAR